MFVIYFRSFNLTVQSLIAAEEKLGVPRSRIVIGGFSQGGAVALYTALTSTSDNPLGGIIGMSTWLPLAKSFPAVSTACRGCFYNYCLFYTRDYFSLYLIRYTII